MHISEAHLNPFSLSANFQQRTLSNDVGDRVRVHFIRKDVERRFVDFAGAGSGRGDGDSSTPAGKQVIV